MTNISFKGFNEKSLTLPCTDEVAAGDLVALNSDGECIKAISGTDFIGICVAKRGDAAAVQMTGYAELPIKGNIPGYGICFLTSNGENGVIITEGDGVYCKVIKVDIDNMIIGFIF